MVDSSVGLASLSSEHWLGMDQLGRDMLSRILVGGRTSVGVAVLVVFLTAVTGTIIGVLASLSDSRLGQVLRRFIDMWLAFPDMIMVIALVAVWGPSLENVVLYLLLVKWAEYARIASGLTLSIRHQEFIAFGYMSGASTWRIIIRYITPNLLAPMMVVACQHIGEIILTVAGFSLIGIGAQPPTAEWGAILMSPQDYLQVAPWLLIYPGLAIFITVILFNWAGDILRDSCDVKGW